MNSIYFCTTPFQILTCLALNKNHSGRLVIIDKFADSKKLCDKIRSLNLFSEVSVFDDSEMWSGNSKSWIGLRLRTVLSYKKCKTLVEHFFPDISTYTDIFVSSRQQVNRLVCMYAAQWLPDVEIHFYDDGLGTYSQSVTKISRLDKLLRWVLVGKKAAGFKYVMHLYSPEIYNAYNGAVNGIEKIAIENDAKRTISRVFDVKARYNYKKILFDTVPTVEFFDEGRPIYTELINLIISRGDVIIKQHPRNKEPRYEAEYFEDISIPFEALCSNTAYDDSVFYTSFSTAVFTPKIIYDQEPTIVFLYGIMKPYRRDTEQNCDLLVDCLKKMYREPEKIVVPKDKYELLNNLKKFVNNYV